MTSDVLKIMTDLQHRVDEGDILAHASLQYIIALRTQLAEAQEELSRRVDMHECAMAERDDATLYGVEQKARAEQAEAEVRNLKAAIFGSENYAHDLKCGNFVEMAQTLHAAQKGGLDRAERAEAALAEIKQTLDAPDDWHPVYAVKALKQSNDRA